MQLRAPTSMYLIAIGKQIEDYVLHCVPCQTHSRSQQKEPAIPVEVPCRPWQKLAMDLFFQGSHWYIIIADYYSKDPWIKKLEAISSKELISVLKFCFSEFGIPEEVISDNGKQFTGKEYQDFAAKYGFKLITSSPYYPKGHGFIERQVQTIKNLLNKCEGDGTDHSLALLQLRATPIDSRLPSPGGFLQNRLLKTTLSATIRPPANNESIRASLQSRQGYTNHDAHGKELPQLLPKQHVWLQNAMTKQWYKTVVKSKAESPWAYVVSKLEGDKRRNRIHLKDACIPKVVPNTQPNPKGSVARKPPSVLVVLKPPGGTGLPKYVLRSVSNPSANSAVGKGIPNTGVNNAVGNQSPIHSVNSGVQNSGIQNSVNSVRIKKFKIRQSIQIRSKKEVKYQKP